MAKNIIFARTYLKLVEEVLKTYFRLKSAYQRLIFDYKMRYIRVKTNCEIEVLKYQIQLTSIKKRK